MKITGKRIEKGMTIRVSGYTHSVDRWMRRLQQENVNQSEKDSLKKELDKGLSFSVDYGGIRKDSPVLKVNDVYYMQSWSYYLNGRKVTFNDLVIDTDKGKMMISTRQNVELIEQADDESAAPFTLTYEHYKILDALSEYDYDTEMITDGWADARKIFELTYQDVDDFMKLLSELEAQEMLFTSCSTNPVKIQITEKGADAYNDAHDTDIDDTWTFSRAWYTEQTEMLRMLQMNADSKEIDDNKDEIQAQETLAEYREEQRLLMSYISFFIPQKESARKAREEIDEVDEEKRIYAQQAQATHEMIGSIEVIASALAVKGLNDRNDEITEAAKDLIKILRTHKSDYVREVKRDAQMEKVAKVLEESDIEHTVLTDDGPVKKNAENHSMYEFAFQGEPPQEVDYETLMESVQFAQSEGISFTVLLDGKDITDYYL